MPSLKQAYVWGQRLQSRAPPAFLLRVGVGRLPAGALADLADKASQPQASCTDAEIEALGKPCASTSAQAGPLGRCVGGASLSRGVLEKKMGSKVSHKN